MSSQFNSFTKASRNGLYPRPARAPSSPATPPRWGTPSGDDLAFVLPFRPETLPVLCGGAAAIPHWSWRYLLGLNLWALDRDEEAAAILSALAGQPDYGPAYSARAHLLQAVLGAPTPAPISPAR